MAVLPTMILLYGAFIALIVLLLVLDLGVFHRKLHVIRVKEALAWSAFWITLAVAFTGFIYAGYENHWFGLGLGVDTMSTPVTVAGETIYNDGSSAAVKYLTGLLVEKSLAVDNIFVIAMVFAFFRVPSIYQHRVLFWGITGALLMRGAMIALGAALITRFSWIIYVFGGFLIITGIRMMLLRNEETEIGDSRIVRTLRRIIPVTERFHGQRFFVRAGTEASHAPATDGGAEEPDRMVAAARKGALLATPLFLALVIVEFTDVIFAVDSIPAIFAITTDAFLVFTSNVFAILGLRSLYFALAGMIDSFRYLKVALSVVLVVIGTKMLTHTWLKEWLGDAFNYYVLGVVGGIIAVGVIASLIARSHDDTPTAP